ncbi:Glycosyltransferase involved in cell wall bisynthesis [Psychroflexus salarius]|uniref:Glycosyltransferase involved in cell wall bisynthesis n=1 Tax=Psychroflexus salarius TaxID=1155689 RepID=A0A1M4V5J5_9FLAO|nr:glycosyltransferase [Psychroflexus salarius]SHE64138.1 Glycosyltransferase involved in cell wall bisynthesis [Psychroflexus salarius]
MTTDKLKVFHGLVNYGTQAGLLSEALRKKGVKSISVVTGDKSKRKVDIELLHGGSILSKVVKHTWNNLRKLYWFFAFNTFHFYFGKTLFKNQIDLPFYKMFGKKVVMEYLGNDVRNYADLIYRYKLPQNHPFYVNQKKHDFKTKKRLINEQKYLNHSFCCLPSHFYFAKQFGVQIKNLLPLAINLNNYKYEIKEPLVERLKILHAPTSRAFKGTEIIISAINKLKLKYDFEFKIVEGVTHKELLEEYKTCDIFIDQISVGWYGTAALEAMAFGKTTMAFIDEIYFENIDYSDEIPVINITKQNIVTQIEDLLDDPEQLEDISKKSRLFVEKYHDANNVAELALTYYKQIWKIEANA